MTKTTSGIRAAPHLLHHLEAVHLGHLDVEEHHVRAEIEDGLDARDEPRSRSFFVAARGVGYSAATRSDGRAREPPKVIRMAKKGQDPLVIASKAKGILKKAGCNTAGDAFVALNGYLYWLLEQAAKRAKANGRKTVRAHDFMV